MVALKTDVRLFHVVRRDPRRFPANNLSHITIIMMMNKKILSFVLVLFAAYFLSGATPGAADAPASEPAASSPDASKYGGRIIFGSIGEPSNLLTFLASDSASHEIGSYFYVAPLKYDKDLSITTWAAESYEVLDGGKLLRFKLRPGILWQDGVELTADDVEFTYRVMIDPKTPTAYAEDFLRIKEFRKTGRYTFEVRYEKPLARSLIT